MTRIPECQTADERVALRAPAFKQLPLFVRLQLPA
jgi:hypothetical protein